MNWTIDVSFVMMLLMLFVCLFCFLSLLCVYSLNVNVKFGLLIIAYIIIIINNNIYFTSSLLPSPSSSSSATTTCADMLTRANLRRWSDSMKCECKMRNCCRICWMQRATFKCVAERGRRMITSLRKEGSFVLKLLMIMSCFAMTGVKK